MCNKSLLSTYYALDSENTVVDKIDGAHAYIELHIF